MEPVAILVDACESGGSRGIPRVEVPSEEALDVAAARLEVAERAPSDPGRIARRAPIRQEQRQQRFPLIRRLTDRQHHLARLALALADAADRHPLTRLDPRDFPIEFRQRGHGPADPLHHQLLDAVPGAQVAVGRGGTASVDPAHDEPAARFGHRHARRHPALPERVVEVGQAPDAGGLVLGRRGEQPAVVGEGEALDPLGMPGELTDLLARAPVEEAEAGLAPEIFSFLVGDRHDRPRAGRPRGEQGACVDDLARSQPDPSFRPLFLTHRDRPRHGLPPVIPAGGDDFRRPAGRIGRGERPSRPVARQEPPRRIEDPGAGRRLAGGGGVIPGRIGEPQPPVGPLLHECHLARAPPRRPGAVAAPLGPGAGRAARRA